MAEIKMKETNAKRKKLAETNVNRRKAKLFRLKKED